jgi:hypothetical protein
MKPTAHPVSLIDVIRPEFNTIGWQQIADHIT